MMPAWEVAVSLFTLAMELLPVSCRPAFAQSPPSQQQRVDTFDKNSNRTGYATIDPKTSRIDFYDKDSNRTGSGQISPPPAASGTATPAPQPSGTKR